MNISFKINHRKLGRVYRLLLKIMACKKKPYNIRELVPKNSEVLGINIENLILFSFRAIMEKVVT